MSAILGFIEPFSSFDSCFGSPPSWRTPRSLFLPALWLQQAFSGVWFSSVPINQKFPHKFVAPTITWFWSNGSCGSNELLWFIEVGYLLHTIKHQVIITVIFCIFKLNNGMSRIIKNHWQVEMKHPSRPSRHL